MRTRKDRKLVQLLKKSQAVRSMVALNKDLVSLLRAAAVEIEENWVEAPGSDAECALRSQQLAEMITGTQLALRAIENPLDNAEHCHRCFEPQMPGNLALAMFCDECMVAEAAQL